MNFKKKIIFAFFIIVIDIYVFGFSKEITYNTFYNENRISEAYEIREQNCKILKDVRNQAIQNNSINLNTIDISQITYSIYSKDKNIIFYYYIIDDTSDKKTYNATITLSKNFKVLEENYSLEEEPFDTYKSDCIKFIKSTSLYYSTLIILFSDFIIVILLRLIKYTFLLFNYIKTRIIKRTDSIDV